MLFSARRPNIEANYLNGEDVEPRLVLNTTRKKYLEGLRNRPQIEKQFDELGEWPLISTVTGVARVILGIGQVAEGLTLASIHAFKSLSENDRTFFQMKMQESLENAFHGLLNIIRGVVEMIPFFGNLACALKDQAIGRIGYSSEKFEPNTFAINWFGVKYVKVYNDQEEWVPLLENDVAPLIACLEAAAYCRRQETREISHSR